MNQLFHSLQNCSLFKQLSLEDIHDIFEKITYSVSNYTKEQIIAVEGEECTSLGIVLKGTLEIKRVYATGKVIIMAHHTVGDIFGEVIIFSEKDQYPATIVSTSNSLILFISQDNIIKLCRLYPQFFYNFMSLLSNRILILNQRIKNLSYETIRQKIAGYLLDEYQKQKKSILTLPYSRKDMAEHLGIPRPSLSRELVHMREEYLIDFYRNTIKIIDINRLEECLF